MVHADLICVPQLMSGEQALAGRSAATRAVPTGIRLRTASSADRAASCVSAVAGCDLARPREAIRGPESVPSSARGVQ
jgi:hypothetical protein